MARLPLKKNFLLTKQGPDGDLPEYNESMDYLCIGKETAPTTGQIHYHIFIQFKAKKRFGQVKKLYPSLHQSSNNGNTPEAGRNYAQKDGDYEEFGEFKGKGHKTNLKRSEKRKAVFDSLRKGTTSIETAVQENIDDIQWLQTSMKYLPSKVVDRKVLYIHGETGIGKTTTTCKYLEEKGLSFYIYNSTAGFLDGYCGQDVIVMDDFRSQLPLVTFLSMTSMYSTPIPVKGSSFPNMSSRIIITSNKQV